MRVTRWARFVEPAKFLILGQNPSSLWHITSTFRRILLLKPTRNVSKVGVCTMVGTALTVVIVFPLRNDHCNHMEPPRSTESNDGLRQVMSRDVTCLCLHFPCVSVQVAVKTGHKADSGPKIPKLRSPAHPQIMLRRPEGLDEGCGVMACQRLSSWWYFNHHFHHDLGLVEAGF